MFCPQCGAPNDAPAKFCFKCGTPLAQAAAPPVAPPVADPRVRGAAVPAAAAGPQVPAQTSPVLATILSLFIPGVGQLINSDMKKGVVMFVLAIVLFAPTVGVGSFAVAIWSAVDAYRVATGAAKRW